jgi:lon-related putative ATP-dependent protease
MTIETLSVAVLRRRSGETDFGFTTTDDLDDLAGIVGQERAVQAMRFGIGMERPGFNIYALGPDGLHKQALVREYVQEKAATLSGPPDYCYVNRFDDPRRPAALALPRGRGAPFQRDSRRMAEDLRDALRAAFESEDYRTRRGLIDQAFKERQEHAVGEVGEEARQHGVALQRTPIGFTFVPIGDDGIITPKQFHQLSEEQQGEIQANIEHMQERLQEALEKIPEWVKDARDQVRKLNEETADRAVTHLIDGLKDRYADLPGIVQHLDAVHDDIVANIGNILSANDDETDTPLPGHNAHADALLRPYMANLIVDNADQPTAPIVYEDEPTVERLVGRVEHRQEMGALTTDFRLIRAGALHRANGGYLIIDAHKILGQPWAWDALKRALRAGEVRIEPAWAMLGLFGTTTLEPEPITLNVKVVLVGERVLYYLLSALDPEFPQLFKVAADFAEDTPRTAEANRLYARMIATLVRREGLRAMRRDGVARILDEAARQAGDAERLSTRFEDIADLIREADYWSRDNGADTIGATDVEAAIQARESRHDRVRERIQDAIARGTLLIDTTGHAVGQINALSVLSMSNFAFAHPTRVTARVSVGRGEVVDIERTVKMGGPLHSKGVLILGGFVRGRFSRGEPLSLAASLVFEQSYGGVDGDSATLAELLALMSATADLPVRQDLAVTGSMNQNGRVQPIGGVNEKIEGFFDVCARAGLSGTQGVVIPAANVKHLMLAERVVAAVARGDFHIHSVTDADDALALFFDRPTGQPDDQGNYPDGTINRAVQDRLRAFARERREFAPSPPAGEGAGGDAS